MLNQEETSIPVLQVEVIGVGLFIAELASYYAHRGSVLDFCRVNGVATEANELGEISFTTTRTRRELDELVEWGNL